MFANSKKVTTFAPAIEREILDKKDGPFVYRLGRKIFILERGVRLSYGLLERRFRRRGNDGRANDARSGLSAYPQTAEAVRRIRSRRGGGRNPSDSATPGIGENATERRKSSDPRKKETEKVKI